MNRGKILSIIGLLLLSSFLSLTVLNYIKNKEESYPRYEIRHNDEIYRTNTYLIDSTGCLNFMSKHRSDREMMITICGKEYSIIDRHNK